MADEAARLAELLRPLIADERVLSAIERTPREGFVPADERARAYENVALPIACDQTISQPLVVARMLQLLELRSADRVLDVGTGSGYHAALLARLADRVWTIERHSKLSAQAHSAITSLDIDNVEFFVGDGYGGLPEYAPYDAINVAAATSPDGLRALEQQLADGGRLVAPVGGARDQRLMIVRRVGERLDRASLEAVRFVPLVRERRRR